MFTPLRHGDHMAFFEIAATLIPILLFGGVVAERMRPGTYESRRRTMRHAFLIPAFGAAAILAEVTAVVAVVSGTSDWWSRLIVAAFLTLGMVAIILSLWLPWIDELRKRDPGQARMVIPGSVALLLLAFLGSVRVMTVGVSGGAEIERLDAYLEAQTRGNSAQMSALNQGASLIAASGRVQQQRIAAEARHEDPAVIASLRSQERRLLSLAIGNSEWRERLLLENANLNREMLGAPTLKLPRFSSHSEKGPKEQHPPTIEPPRAP